MVEDHTRDDEEVKARLDQEDKILVVPFEEEEVAFSAHKTPPFD